MAFEITEISPEFHDLAGIGDISYIYNSKINELKIYVNGILVKTYYNDEAKKISGKMKDNIDILNPYERVIDGKALAVFGHGINILRIRTRKPEIKEERQIAMRWLKMNSRLSLAKIGAMFGYDHATVLNAEKHVNDLMCVDMDFKRNVELFDKA